MRRNYPRNTRRDPGEHYDHIYRAMSNQPSVSMIIDHPRKLVIHNVCADPYSAEPEEIFRARTCYDDELEEVL